MLYKAVVFDAYGTLFNVHAIQELSETIFEGQGAAIAILWRDKQIEYTRLITQSDPHNPQGSQYYLPFRVITERALEFALKRLKLSYDASHVSALMAQYDELTAFPENLGVLQKIKSAGLTTAILSNGSPDMLASAVQSAGMVDCLDHVISVDAIKQFKTSPESYALVEKTFLKHGLTIDKNDVLFVSSNAWDIVGASWFGFKTFWVNRQGLPFETIGNKPDFAGSNLNDVLTVLNISND
jgi:2-haloacid dehalogenase